ncbi:hypothetical protein PybrP1_001919 [[Pythium] brassicae (nom. inval.)]|nr:hypothetical protein PybrP1_001919 [[Pythium] brassicae (nom. inval.)]
MGNTPSAEDLEVALKAQTPPYVAFDSRFCFAEPTTLRVQGHLGHDDFEVFHLKSRELLFRIHTPSIVVAEYDRTTIYDAQQNNRAIVALHKELARDNYFVTNAEATKHLFKVDASIGIDRIVINARFGDPVSGKKCRIETTGTRHTVVVWSVRASDLTPTPIARISGYEFSSYNVEVAPGVDSVLAVLLCFVKYRGT